MPAASPGAPPIQLLGPPLLLPSVLILVHGAFFHDEAGAFEEGGVFEGLAADLRSAGSLGV